MKTKEVTPKSYVEYYSDNGKKFKYKEECMLYEIQKLLIDKLNSGVDPWANEFTLSIPHSTDDNVLYAARIGYYLVMFPKSAHKLISEYMKENT